MLWHAFLYTEAHSSVGHFTNSSCRAYGMNSHTGISIQSINLFVQKYNTDTGQRHSLR